MRVAPQKVDGLPGRTPSERALALDIAAVAGGEPRRPPSGPGGGLRVRWWHGSPLNHRQQLVGQEQFVEALAVGMIDKHPVIATASCGTVCIWDARTSTTLRRLRDGDRRLGAVAMGFVDDRPLIVSGGSDGVVCSWDARTGSQWCGLAYHGCVKAVAVGVVTL